MNCEPLRGISEDEIETFNRDGVVCLRGLFDLEWVEYLRDKVAADMAVPSGMVKDVNAQGATGNFFGDTFVSHNVEGFKKAIHESPMGEIAGTILRSSKANLIFDQILVKEPNTSTETLWHHDATYWPVDGDAIGTLWLALDSATEETGAMEFVAGSHRWGKRFKAVSFDPAQEYLEDLPPVPDIEAERDSHRIVRYDLEPGDCTIHHGLTVHHAPGNSSPNRRRRAYLTRWAGDGVTYNPRPNLQRMLRDPGIEPGSALDCSLFPVVWRCATRVDDDET
ncbi:MAG: phytanoyl-CoA dioxygenase family protein [Chromatiales bacterium]|jgi:ectoine hydroxylase-related dioxygenase (phytanoyl-CoA dioxygenase family)|nr:phytanoyl-CoA dioxygenase family protein [Chromatiales bacterium]